jgi:hypothetical protein
MCLLRISTLRNYIWGVIPKKLHHFSTGIEIPSLNVESNNFRTARPILVIHSSNDATPQKESNYMGQLLKFVVWELLSKNSPKGSFSAKILHSITFLHNRFIQTVTRLMQLGK